MAFLNLDVEIEYDFSLIAISSNQKPHTLGWAINRNLDSNLSLETNYVIKTKALLKEFKKYRSDIEGFCFVLLCNKNLSQRLVAELPTVDYFVKYYPDELVYSEGELVSRLRKLKEIQAVFMIDINNLKSKQVFIFD
ncbi:MAG: IPExxxVDY family protein [Flavobacteriales bacterium]